VGCLEQHYGAGLLSQRCHGLSAFTSFAGQETGKNKATRG
jgi:hypothetical protein